MLKLHTVAKKDYLIVSIDTVNPREKEFNAHIQFIYS